MSRTPHTVWDALAAPQQVLTDIPVVGDASRAHPVPSPAGTPLTVDAHLVEHGDVLFGLRTPIASILTDGAWWYYGDEHGTILARREVGSRVQVLRPAPRPLRLVP